MTSFYTGHPYALCSNVLPEQLCLKEIRLHCQQQILRFVIFTKCALVLIANSMGPVPGACRGSLVAQKLIIFGRKVVIIEICIL